MSQISSSYLLSPTIATSYATDAGSAVPALNILTVAGGTNINTSGAGSTVTVNLDAIITLTTVNATTFDTSVAAAGVTLAGTSLVADGTSADIDINITAKGTGQVIIDDLNVSGLTAGTIRSSATGDISSLADSADGTLLIGKTGNVPIWATLSNGNNITSTAGANSISIAVTGTTEHALQVGSAAGALTSLAVGTTGTILQGVTGADPAWSTATYPATTLQGDILYSSADNTIIVLAKDANATRYLSNTGVSNNPAWAQVNLTNGVTGVLQAANGGLLAWTEVTDATVNLVGNSAYIMNRGTLITATLPATAAKGSVIKITGLGAGLFLIAQNALQSINFCSATTTVGIGGSLAATQAYDGVELVCVVANTTFNVTSSIGNLTLV